MTNNNIKFKSNIHQRCFNFSLNIIKLFDNAPQKRNIWIIEDQLIRSSTSIGANLIEGKDSSSRLEFKKFYEIALKSANETIYWLELLKELNILDGDKINKLLVEVNEIAKMLASGVIKLKAQKF